METIIFINGKVKFPITIDPLVWTFMIEKLKLIHILTMNKRKLMS